ncbi:SLC13 family permease [Nitrosomonas halophila]|uniref:Solute carrier family 13 (Sodium-dependent dicarboxylate transporter), member 2/3/5 n=1 Tax=Nitrosomonas halophila TaxID=44576 RepID=A0A1H3D6W9_9PROT|nr:DASS family sodium-coupled anion symporter [Nitrosomonas halophila]SDX62262.1 solute carrier family 13 (sodium-dependent dicarboxylate transporter), member 2/3/5 [Nitrosomonas halophila]
MKTASKKPPIIRLRIAGWLTGPALLAMTILFPAPEGMSVSAWYTAGIALLLAVWWSTEVLPIPVTSLLPILLFPALGVMSTAESTASYAAPTIFLLLGGFLIAMGLEKWNLHRRLALHLLARTGNNPAIVLAGFMGITALLSMWISNTASALMMTPIALSLTTDLAKTSAHQRFTLCLMLGIAYSASIGGLATIIGTPPNLLLVAFMQQTYGFEISFLDWMLLGLPVAGVMLCLAWWVLLKWAMPFDISKVRLSQGSIVGDLKKLGKLSVPEKRLAFVFLLVATAWIVRVPVQQYFPMLSWLDDTLIAVGGAVLMFIIPAGGAAEKWAALLDWERTRNIPWGVLLLFGAGLSLARGIEKTGLALWLGEHLAIATTLQPVLMIAGLVALVIFMTELTSNTATTATLLPVLAALSLAGDLTPMLLFAPAALAASCAFMLPVATAPNAVVYSTGNVTIPQMARAGLKLNLIGILVITGMTYWIAPWIFG